MFKISLGCFRGSCYTSNISKTDTHSSCVPPADQFRPGVRYHFFLYGCRNHGYQLLRSVIGYVEELGKLNGYVFLEVQVTGIDNSWILKVD